MKRLTFRNLFAQAHRLGYELDHDGSFYTLWSNEREPGVTRECKNLTEVAQEIADITWQQQQKIETKNLCTFINELPADIIYEPVIPQPDSDFLAAQGQRVILYNGLRTSPITRLFLVPQGEIHAGWVIGIVSG